jgi:hypothetical protein
MKRTVWVWVIFGLILLCIGGALGGAVVLAVPNAGSAPSIYDDFQWSSTANGFWHVNPVGGSAIIKNGTLTLAGHSIELDHRIQTDPYVTVAVARVRALSFDKFALGLGLYHSGTVSFEFDADGAKCGRGTDQGFAIDYVKPWAKPPVDRWYYLGIRVTDPYPNPTPALQAKLNAEDSKFWKPVKITCALWNSSGKLIGADTPLLPRPNTHYVSLDEAYVRTWDSLNDYQIDWIYAGPPSGIPHGIKF